VANVVGVRYKKAGRIYYFDPAGLDLKAGDSVVVDTARGPELGQVMFPICEIPDEELELPLKSVLRLAQPGDCACACKRHQKETQAVKECSELVAKLGLPMKLLRAEYNLDESYVTIYFSSAGRVDFRELVRELGRCLKVRVELRQIGPRDETKLLGGFGRCGRELCCACYLTDFEPVSIKMAKEQNLPLNPAKISGACGRLLCCLGYEYQMYRDSRRNEPQESSANPVVENKQETQSTPVAASAEPLVPELALLDELTATDVTASEPPHRARRRHRR